MAAHQNRPADAAGIDRPRTAGRHEGIHHHAVRIQAQHKRVRGCVIEVVLHQRATRRDGAAQGTAEIQFIQITRFIVAQAEMQVVREVIEHTRQRRTADRKNVGGHEVRTPLPGHRCTWRLVGQQDGRGRAQVD